jgi:hypothetical protein
MKRYLLVFLMITNWLVGLYAQKILYDTNPQTGAIDTLAVQGDKSGMNWILKTDGSQYPWVKEKYGWGLGHFQLKMKNGELKDCAWETPTKISADGKHIVYLAGDIRINIDRHYAGNDLVETYTIINRSKETVSLSDIGIYTPFNDNYPDAKTCINMRTNVHIWEGGNAAYVNCLRMGGYAPHLGLVLTEGAVESYEIHERGINRANSQFRGVIALIPPDITLEKGETYTLSWRIFSHNGNEDFENKLLEYGSITAKSDKYTVEKGDTVILSFLSNGKLENPALYLNGNVIPMTGNIAKVVITTPGENRFELVYNGGKKTHINVWCISDIENLIAKRVYFILKNQQMNDTDDERFGALMVYDNERNKIYLNDTPNCNPVDRDEGAERIGMGVLLAKQYLLHPNPELKASLLRYAKFLREKLQTADYVTYSSVDKKGRNRGYNYVWAAMFYFEMYKITGNRQFATDGYETLQAMYRQFGYGFYAIHIPVRLGLQTLKAAGMKAEYEDLKADFLQTGDIFIKNGLNYPKHEVNYEQSIVAPAVSFLAQLYLETGIQKYLDEARRQLPVLEVFNGQQPSYHLNDIAIRHWDGYWFGKREMFGDTFPHYWSVLTGEAFHYYALCTGDSTCRHRAESIVRNNLCLFSENGKASCAYLYPSKVDGIKAQFYDPYANDQDWALVSYLTVNDE